MDYVKDNKIVTNLQFYSGTRVNKYGFLVTILKPVIPVRYNFFPIYISMV
jgi:hypothetical protein